MSPIEFSFLLFYNLIITSTPSGPILFVHYGESNYLKGQKKFSYTFTIDSNYYTVVYYFPLVKNTKKGSFGK